MSASEIRSAIELQQLARDIQRAHVDLQDCDRKLETAEGRAQSLRDERDQRRLEIGRMLVHAKAQTEHGEWLKQLAAWGIHEQSAREWMRLAEHVESKPGLDLPTRAEVNAARNQTIIEDTATVTAAPVADVEPKQRRTVRYPSGELVRSQVEVLVHALFVLEREGDPKSQAAAIVIRRAFGLEA